MDWESEDAELQRALALSLQENQKDSGRMASSGGGNNNNNNNLHYEESEEEALAKALAMSLEQSDTSATASQSSSHYLPPAGHTTGIPSPDHTTSTEPLTSSSSSSSPMYPIPPVNASILSLHVRKWFETASPISLESVHDLLWDPYITVPNDQRRWLAQSITFKSEIRTREAGATTSSSSSSSSSVGNSLSIMDHADLWGLIQAHGGPCGVLASVQAELLRLLLFGIPPLPNRNPNDEDSTLVSFLMTTWDRVQATQDTNGTNTATGDRNNKYFSPEALPACLALSLGIIVARVAYQPTASLGDDTSNPPTEETTRSSMTMGSSTVSSTANVTPTVQLIFPKQPTTNDDDSSDNDIQTHLEWKHLAPWNADDPTSPTGTGGMDSSDTSLNHYLVSYSISLNARTNPRPIDPTSTCSSIDELSQKEEDDQETLLAYAVATFLLETKLWQWYTRPGGVLWFVIALIQSRTAIKIKSDMDDPNSKLTSQFGHCSQELLNLLLTGQAVSNVFDHTLRPSGDLICRGIQKRPSIGYLSLLESLRYLQVGGYYKRPSYPIWVIGSTSHFTVMFGDDVVASLYESKSDQILEAVRRAFQQMDGAEEQGFIRLDQLGDFFRKLDLYERLGPSGIQTLGATMEVHGAGILLWEDVWKRTSRLLTGATLEAVLNSDDITTNSDPTTSSALVSLDATGGVAPISPTAVLSDEEYARQLQAEWDGQLNPVPPTPKVPIVQQQVPQKESFGKTFRLYHYNGLRGGTRLMKPFHVTPLSSQEVIGASVSLSGASRSDSFLRDSPGGLEDVLWTKWPSCRIAWSSESPPSID